MGNSLAVRPDTTALEVATSRAPVALMRPIAAPAMILEAQEALRELVQKALVRDRDYGVIPGTGDKPALLKAGAERVAIAYGCYYGDPEIIEKEIDHDRVVHYVKRRKKWRNAHRGDREFTWEVEPGESIGLYRYVLRIPVISRETGDVVGYGIGSASTMESKYIDRPRDCENTVLKMAHKRGLVAGALVTFGLSDQFTQDVDEQAGEAPTNGNGEAPTNSNGNGGTSTPAAAQQDDDDEELTLDAALVLPLPGSPTAWGGNGGKPLGELTGKLLARIEKWADEKVQVAEPDPKMVRVRDAARLVLKAKGAGETKEQPQMALEQPAPAAGSGGPVTPPPPGKVSDAIAPNPKPVGVSELTQSIGKLLEHEALTPNDRSDFRKKLNTATTVEALQLLIGELEERIALPF